MNLIKNQKYDKGDNAKARNTDAACEEVLGFCRPGAQTLCCRQSNCLSCETKWSQCDRNWLEKFLKIFENFEFFFRFVVKNSLFNNDNNQDNNITNNNNSNTNYYVDNFKPKNFKFHFNNKFNFFFFFFFSNNKTFD